MNRSWIEIFSFSLAGVLPHGLIMLALVASCSKDRKRMLAPPDPTAMLEEQDASESSGQDSETVVDVTAGSEEDSSSDELEAVSTSTGGAVSTTQSAVFGKETCESFFTIASSLMESHAYYKSFEDLDGQWAKSMCSDWISTFDGYELYWDAKEAKVLREKCAANLQVHMQKQNCRGLDSVPSAWLEIRDQMKPSVATTKDFDPKVLVTRMIRAKKNDLWLLRTAGFGNIDRTFSDHIEDEFANILMDHADYQTSDLAHLTLRAFVKSLDGQSSYALGRYASSHSSELSRLIPVVHHYPLQLVQVGDTWVFSATKEAEEHHEEAESANGAAEPMHGDYLTGIFAAESMTPLVQSADDRTYIAAEFLHHRKSQLAGQSLHMTFKKPGSSSDATAVTLADDHSLDKTYALKTQVHEFENFTRNENATVVTLNIAHFHNHDKSVRLYSQLVRKLQALIHYHSPEALVLDLRGNKEGAFSDMTKLLSLFDGGIDAKKHALYYSSRKDQFSLAQSSQDVNFPKPVFGWDKSLVILVDQETGGASEFFSHVLQKTGKAIVVGGPYTEGYGHEQSYILPTEQWDGAFITSRIFHAFNGSTWNCHGLNLDIPFKLVADKHSAQPKECHLYGHRAADSDGYADKGMLRKLASSFFKRYNLDPKATESAKDPDLQHAALIALDEYFLKRYESGTPGRYRLISSEVFELPTETGENGGADESESTEKTRVEDAGSDSAAAYDDQYQEASAVVAGFHPPVNAASSADQSYAMIISEDIQKGFVFRVCDGEASLAGESLDFMNSSYCVSLFQDAGGVEYRLPYEKFASYSLDDAMTDSNNFLHSINIHAEERRLFIKSTAMGLAGGAFSGGATISAPVIASIAGVSVVDSTMDAVAGVPGHPDKNVGIPKVATITSSGTALGSIAGLGLVVGGGKAITLVAEKFGMQAAKLPLVRKVMTVALVLVGIHVAFFSDSEKIARNPLHPFSWLAQHLWRDPSIQLAESWPKMVAGEASVAMSNGDLRGAAESLAGLLIERELADSTELAFTCLPQKGCEETNL